VRRRDPVPVVAPAVPGFTPAQLARIRELIAAHDSWPVRAHPHPVSVELAAIHAAAGRTRSFKLWELDPVTDVDAAFTEEITHDYWGLFRAPSVGGGVLGPGY